MVLAVPETRDMAPDLVPPETTYVEVVLAAPKLMAFVANAPLEIVMVPLLMLIVLVFVLAVLVSETVPTSVVVPV